MNDQKSITFIGHLSIAVSILACSIPLAFVMFFISPDIAVHIVPAALKISVAYFPLLVLFRMFNSNVKK